MTWVAAEGYGLYPAPETLGFVPMVGETGFEPTTFCPTIYSEARVEGWRKVTSAVHAKGGRIFLQIWHVGRQSHVDMTNGATPVAR
jgi:2,4-dienoyl-CoA reductase-like NADH-dependent reductase (Old Yellow Enzyme family)